MRKFNDIFMKSAVLTALLLLLFTNCIRNDITVQRFNLPEFDYITNNTFANVYITPSYTQSVEIEATEMVLNNLILDVDNHKLTIDYRKRLTPWYGPTNIYIRIPYFTGYNLNGSGNLTIDQPFDSCETVYLEINGSGNIDANLHLSNYINSHINGSGNIDLQGYCPFQDIRISGSGNVNAEYFKTKLSDVEISGSGNCIVHADSILNAYISGSGNIRYKGHPIVTSRITGSGNIRSIF